MLTTDSSVSARAGHTDGDCLCVDIAIMAVRAGIHRDDILAALNVCMHNRRIIRAHCHYWCGIKFRGLVNLRVIMGNASSQSCCRNGADQDQRTDESQSLFHLNTPPK